MATDRSHAYPEQRSSLTLDTVLEVVADQRRRYILYSLHGITNNAISFETLVEDVATLEAAQAQQALTREQYQDVAADLYHWHLPVLADLEIIDYDPRHDLIRYWSPPLLMKWVTLLLEDEVHEGN